MKIPARRLCLAWLGGLALLATAGAAQPQGLSGSALVKALQGGGYVLLMRHAGSPRTPPEPGAANKDNPKPERQLDEAGRNSAKAMGQALAKLRIPVGLVLSSPTYRALETIRLAALGPAKTFPELGEGEQGMQGPASAASSAWLRLRVAEAPRQGTNTIVVTHFPNISSAFSQDASNLADGEALVFRPDGKGAATLVARIKIEQWPELAASTP
ncbi:MAG: histidine phosphatase family protein [Caulobacteraceae bacterium]